MTFEEMTEQLRIRINSHIEQHTCFFTAKADGQRRFHLNVRNVVSGSVYAFYWDTTAAAWMPLPAPLDVDELSGWAAIDVSIPVYDGDRFRVDLAYSDTPIDLIYTWLNAGINALWPQLFLIGSSTISLSSSTYDYDFPAGADNVVKVETRGTGTGRWIDNTAWDIDEGNNRIHFYRGPGTGEAKLTYLTRPTGNFTVVDELDDFCTATGLPERAIEAVLLYMEYEAALYQLSKRASSRLSVNYTHTAARDNVLSAQVQARYAAFAAYKQAVAMQPPVTGMRVPL